MVYDFYRVGETWSAQIPVLGVVVCRQQRHKLLDIYICVVVRVAPPAPLRQDKVIKLISHLTHKRSPGKQNRSKSYGSKISSAIMAHSKINKDNVNAS